MDSLESAQVRCPDTPKMLISSVQFWHAILCPLCPWQHVGYDMQKWVNSRQPSGSCPRAGGCGMAKWPRHIGAVSAGRPRLAFARAAPPPVRKRRSPRRANAEDHLLPQKKETAVTDSLDREPTGSHACVYRPRPTVARATPVVVVILVLVQQWLSRVEVSVILGGG